MLLFVLGVKICLLKSFTSIFLSIHARGLLKNKKRKEEN